MDSAGGTDPDTADGIIERTLKQFKSSLTSVQLDSFPLQSLTDVKTKILSIQLRQERNKTLMNFSRIRFYLERFDEFDKVCRCIKVGGIEGAEISGFIWGPSALILEVCQEDSSVLDTILDAYQKFGKRIPDLHQYGDIHETAEVPKCLAFMYDDLLRFYSKILKLLSGSRVWKKTFQANWKDFEHTFASILKSFDAHSKVLKNLLATREKRALEDARRRINDHIIRSEDYHRDIQQHIDQYEEDREEILTALRNQEEKRKADQRSDVLRWLSTPGLPQNEYHKKFKSARDDFPETGTWILAEEKIVNWMVEDTPRYSMLWLNGKKGAGKTVLASVIIEACTEILNFSTSYFYCREDDSNQNSGLAVLKGILRQLVEHSEDLLPSCWHKRNRGEEILNDHGTVKSLLDLFLDYDSNHFVVIDGLDECTAPEIKPIVQFWTNMVTKCDKYKPGKLRVLFVSQDDNQIRKLMQAADILDLHPAQSSKDIEKYVARQFSSLQVKFELTDDEARNAQTLVCVRAEGMFLFAVLTVENLLAQPTLGDLKDELRDTNFPKSLKEAYHKIMERLKKSLHEKQWAKAKKIFCWLAGAKRPLKSHELQAALAVEIDDEGNGDLDYRHNQLRQDVREICGSLVQVLPDRIEFIHSTTKSYIVESEQLDKTAIECDLTILCLTYLTFECFRPDLVDEDIKHFVKEGYYTFQDYAISRWKHHLESLIERMPDMFKDPRRKTDYESRLEIALAKFLDFHKESIETASQTHEKKMTKMQRALRLSAPSPQPISPPASQPSPGIPPLPESPTPSPQFAQQGVTPAEFCQAFQHTSFYRQLVELWTHVYKHETGDFNERNKVSLPRLGDALLNIRNGIEQLWGITTPQSRGYLEKYYGKRVFKCQRVTCDYFHEGFDSKAAVEKHSNRHDRPFRCPIQGCSLTPLGFSASKDRDKHIRQYHPDELGLPSQFIAETKREGADAKWICEICNKRFTRQGIKKAHVDSHYGTRAYACETCGKRFTRANDRNRHRKLHLRAPNGRDK